MNIIQPLSLVSMIITLIFMASVHASSYDNNAARCFALNLYWEARSEGRDGMIAVGWVVLNRMSNDKYPNAVCAVIQQGGERPPCEFNWWCDGRSDLPTEPKSWKLAQQITDQMLSDPPPDPTAGALWFHLDSIQVPNWLRSRKRTLHLGRHYFYR